MRNILYIASLGVKKVMATCYFQANNYNSTSTAKTSG
jgi:hypothetical protein